MGWGVEWGQSQREDTRAQMEMPRPWLHDPRHPQEPASPVFRVSPKPVKVTLCPAHHGVQLAQGEKVPDRTLLCCKFCSSRNSWSTKRAVQTVECSHKHFFHE